MSSSSFFYIWPTSKQKSDKSELYLQIDGIFHSNNRYLRVGSYAAAVPATVIQLKRLIPSSTHISFISLNLFRCPLQVICNNFREFWIMNGTSEEFQYKVSKMVSSFLRPYIFSASKSLLEFRENNWYARYIAFNVVQLIHNMAIRLWMCSKSSHNSKWINVARVFTVECH